MSNLAVDHSRTVSQGTDQMLQLVTFKLDQEEYGLDVLSVREIIRMPVITRMPNTPPDMEGIINLRGKVVPIMSLRRRFGLCDQDADRNSRILVMELASGLTGFVVDAVAEVIRIRASEIQPPPDMVQGQTGEDQIVGVLNQSERLLIVLDLDRYGNELGSLGLEML